MAHNPWEAVGVLAHTQPTQHRPVPSYKASEGAVTLSGTTSRAVVGHASAQDKRRQPRLTRASQAAQSPIHTAAGRAAQRESCCRAAAAAAAVTRRARPAPYQRVDVTGAERLGYGRGRPRAHQPRAVKAIRSRLKTPRSPQTERRVRLEAEAGCCGLRTTVPTAGALAHRARDLLTVYNEQPGTEHNDGVLQEPVMVHSRFLKQPERSEAFGRVFLLALLLWRVMERARRRHVDPTRTPLPGWDKQGTERPTACMMVTQCAGGSVVKLGHARQRARPLSVVPQHSLTALDVPATCVTLPAGSQRSAMAAQRLSRRHKPNRPW